MVTQEMVFSAIILGIAIFVLVFLWDMFIAGGQG